MKTEIIKHNKVDYDDEGYKIEILTLTTLTNAEYKTIIDAIEEIAGIMDNKVGKRKEYLRTLPKAGK